MSSKSVKILVTGVAVFWISFKRKLVELGHHVIGVDNMIEATMTMYQKYRISQF